MNPTADRPAAPRTWFSRTPDALRDPDQEAFLAIGAAMVAAAAPLVIAAAGIVYLAGRLLADPLVVAHHRRRDLRPGRRGRVRPGWSGRPLRRRRPPPLDPGPASLGSAEPSATAGPPLLGALAPLSLPLALVAGGVALGFAELRRPVWRTDPAVGKAGRRRERERTRLADSADTLTADGRSRSGSTPRAATSSIWSRRTCRPTPSWPGRPGRARPPPWCRSPGPWWPAGPAPSSTSI